MKNITVGLFGTCGGSLWRDPFMARYEQEGISYFNPVVKNWTPDCSIEEARHLATDDIILFPVTDETFAFGSLAETGYSVATVLASLEKGDRRNVIIMVTPEPNASLKEDNAKMWKESFKARALARAHLSHINHELVFVVESLEEMLETSLKCAESLKQF